MTQRPGDRPSFSAEPARSLSLFNSAGLLRGQGVIAQRRDRFISPQFTSLQACLDQSLCPTDARTFKVLVDSANRVTGQDLDPAILAAEVAYFEHWGKTSIALGNPIGATLAGFAVRLAEPRNSWRKIVREAISIPRIQRQR